MFLEPKILFSLQTEIRLFENEKSVMLPKFLVENCIVRLFILSFFKKKLSPFNVFMIGPLGIHCAHCK